MCLFHRGRSYPMDENVFAQLNKYVSTSWSFASGYAGMDFGDV